MQIRSVVIGAVLVLGCSLLSGTGLASATELDNEEQQQQQQPAPTCIVACHGYESYTDDEVTPALKAAYPSLGEYKDTLPAEQELLDDETAYPGFTSGGNETEQ